jgi:hypothetical protein
MSLGLEVPPTAMQAVTDVQATLNRPLAPAPAWSGVGWIAHLLPFECSARVTGVLRRLIELPTAVQAEAEVQDTAFRAVRWKANGGMRGLGAGWIRHRVPSQRSARDTKLGELFPSFPTAVHADADVHDTAARKLDCAPSGLGEGTIRHAVPFHCSASVPALDAPTATQDDADGHDTLLNPAPPCEGLGVGWICHVLPFHCSASVPALENPVAVHDEVDVQATLAKLPPPCGGLGVGWICHVLPFHCSARVPALENPVAVQDEADVQDTLDSAPPPAEGLGAGWIRHRVPFQRSAKGTGIPEPLTAWPTPTHAEGDEQATLNSVLSLAPGGLGVGWLAHLAPSQCSARVSPTPEPWVKSPTAVHEDELEQATPKSRPVRANRFRVGTIDHPDPEDAAGWVGNARGAVSFPVALPNVDAANAGTARNPNGNSTATNHDPENRLRAELMLLFLSLCAPAPPRANRMWS